MQEVRIERKESASVEVSPRLWSTHRRGDLRDPLLPTALNNFKAHFPPLKRISCARRQGTPSRQEEEEEEEKERRGREASYLGLAHPTPW